MQLEASASVAHHDVRQRMYIKDGIPHLGRTISVSEFIRMTLGHVDVTEQHNQYTTHVVAAHDLLL
jgi:hypothetical protein